MSPIEEPLDGDTDLSIAKDAAKSTENGTVQLPGPALPPNMRSPAQSMDEVAKELKRIPFFMTSLDDAGDEENVELEAMRALMYEGPRLEIADNFREQGNEAARAKDWKNGQEFYSKALAALKVERKEEELREFKGEGGRQKEEEADRKEMELREKCLVNRALCHLELKNYRSCGLDCESALGINPQNIKAHYRLSHALFSLNKLPGALQAANVGLSTEPTNAPLKALHVKIIAKKAAQDMTEQKRRDEAQHRNKESEVLKSALQVRKIRLRKTADPPDLEDASLKLVPDPLLMSSTLVFPTLILYPLHAQSDFIKAFGEEQTLGGHLDYLFPLPWDERGEYTKASAEAYLETTEGGLIKWGKKVPLLTVISGGRVEIMDGCVRVSVVPKTRAAEFIDEFKRRRGKR